MGAFSKHSPKHLGTMNRLEKVFELRCRGHSFSEIAETIRKEALEHPTEIYAPPGYNRMSVYRDLDKVIKMKMELLKNEIEQETRLDLARMDIAIQKIFPKVEEGQLDAIDRLLKIIEKRIKIFGGDKIITEIKAKIEFPEVEIPEYLRKDENKQKN